MSRTGRVVIASTRAAAGVYEDRCGPIIVDWLNQRSIATADPVVVADGSPVGPALRAALAENVDVIITSGGTGISPTDATPQATAAVLDYQIPGLADALRRRHLWEARASEGIGQTGDLVVEHRGGGLGRRVGR